ncbi:hypothetical protein [Pedobacter miscanthi]|uniref:Uncharacterized protein n=1 Tax=Pedobacter miscanthi TaxID=2259170 RepID=A0A366LC89_9SPHI|nr:hypothetical protein [Pedobacter miscanthi]RBQ11517.1 hypothetical protein DRW42_03380 [Pedobacter miscanthi]
MMQQLSNIEITGRMQEIRAQVAALLQEEKFIEESILFIESHFKEQGAIANYYVSTKHLNVLQDIILEMELREKIGANWDHLDSNWTKAWQILSAFQRPMRISEITKLMGAMDGREDLDKLVDTIKSLFQFKMRKGVLACTHLSKKHVLYHLIKPEYTPEHLKILEDITLQKEFRKKMGTNWDSSNSNWNKIHQILSAFQRPMRIIEIAKLMGKMDGREDLKKLMTTIRSIFQLKIRKGVLASTRLSKKYVLYHLIKPECTPEHLKILEDITLQKEFREKIGTNWNSSNGNWDKVCQIFSAFQRPMRLIEIAKLIANMDGREDLEKLKRTIERLFQSKMEKGVLASISLSKRHVRYHLIE